METLTDAFDSPRWLALRKVPASTAREGISELLREAERGDRIVITRNGKPAVALVPLTDLVLLLHRDSDVEKRMLAAIDRRQTEAGEDAVDFEQFIAAAPSAGDTSIGAEAADAMQTRAPGVANEKTLHLATVLIADILGKMSEAASEAAVAGVVKRLDRSNSLAVEQQLELKEEVLVHMDAVALDGQDAQFAEAAESG